MLIVVIVACTPPAPRSPGEPPPAAAASCDLTAHAFEQTSTSACAKSKWKFEAHGDGTFDATEAGCTSATGAAHYDGKTLVLDFTYADGVGRYEWPLDASCQGAPGKVSWTEGSLAGKSAQSTLSVAR
jgi:hypothetical protein